MRFILDGQHVENVLAFLHANPTPPTAGDLANLGAALLSWWEDTVAPIMPSALSFNEIHIRGLSVINDIEYTVATSTQGQGVLSGAALPNNATFCISFRSAFTGRSARGRAYVPAVVRNAVTQNELDSGSVESYRSMYEALFDLAHGADFRHVILSRVASGVKRDEAVPFTVINYLAVDNIIDSQRRRLPGRGE